jgi:tRNA dimethylallyltransferase
MDKPLQNKYLITIIGPTAIGKTALSIELAKHFKCDIISADSRQFFKEMAIGTAVPSGKELAAAQHHFIQDKSIFKEYTVGDFEREAIEKLDELFAVNDFAVMIGGSGLYIDAVLKGFDDFPDVDPGVRARLIREYESHGISYLQQELERLDPVHYEKVARENPQRLMRALEVCISSGKPYSSFLNIKKNSRDFIPIIIGLEAEREIMYSRINERVDGMVVQGLIDEAKSLYPNRKLNALQTVGYRELFVYFDGDCTLEFAIEEIKKNTRRFAKRQMTWFKRTEGAAWFDYKTPHQEIINFIQSRTNAHSR